MTTDPRIDAAALGKKHGELPHDPQAQNTLWYRLYKRHIESVQVSEAHKIYLLTRDMTALSAVLAVSFSIGMMVGSADWGIVAFYSVALVVQYLVLAKSARNYGIRFVLNVLVEESYSK